MIARGAVFAADLAFPYDESFVAWAPFYHMASTDQALATLMRGGTVYCTEAAVTARSTGTPRGCWPGSMSKDLISTSGRGLFHCWA